MNTYYAALELMARQASIASEDWERFVERTRIRHVKQGTRIIEAGQLVNHAYFCAEGLFRLFYTLADGREYNVAFTVEHDYATS